MQEFLNSRGIRNEIIDYDFSEKIWDPRKMLLPERTEYKKEQARIEYLSRINPFFEDGMKKRRESMKAFETGFLHLSDPVHSLRQAGELADRRYTAVVCGSDQIWLPSHIIEKYYTLSFVPKGVRRVAYAPSFGVESMPGFLKGDCRRFMKKFDALSVREDTGAKIVEDIIGAGCFVAADPTMLLEPEEWENSMGSEWRASPKRYVLAYFLGDSEGHRKAAKEAAKKRDMDLSVMPSASVTAIMDEFYADRFQYDISPEHFVSFIKNADLVITDSFHAAVFSIIFKKQFYCFERFRDDDSISTNSRLQSLLRNVGLEDRLLKWDESAIPEDGYIDHIKVEKTVKKIRKRSADYLINAIGGADA